MKRHFQHGYTLIELVVSLGILLFLVGGGIAAYVRFQDKQAVVAGVNTIKMQLRIAQTRARVGDAPQGCDQLQAYAVRTVANSDQITMVALCDSGEIERKTVQLPTGVTTNSTSDIRFLTLHGGVAGAGTVTIESTAGYTFQFDVTQGGEMTEGDFVATPSPSPSPSPSASPHASPTPQPSPSGNNCGPGQVGTCDPGTS